MTENKPDGVGPESRADLIARVHQTIQFFVLRATRTGASTPPLEIGLRVVNNRVGIASASVLRDRDRWLVLLSIDPGNQLELSQAPADELVTLSTQVVDILLLSNQAMHRPRPVWSRLLSRLCAVFSSSRLTRYDRGSTPVFHFLPAFREVYFQYREYNGKPFTVLGVANPSDYGYEEEGVLFSIQFEDGTRIAAWPEEVLEREARPAQ